ncbi:dnaJ-like protein 60 [Drosophila albomicans]|uniref:DnaJ-like protein 60 n=1 Tax=Drosophila albomicans TaxID=7291 RepID=A0A6P8WXX8_DROAB|nr:dnaJ-like protein 60 [Drosophila albomicans]
MLRIPSYSLAMEATSRRNFAQTTKLNAKKAETHYDVLNLSHDCSKRDIRNAFLRLSKQYHPDVKHAAEQPDSAARFVKITEAYQTLVKPSSRREYDDSLLWNPGGRSARETIHPWEVKPNYNPNPGPYYGIKGFNRVSNWKVALFLISLGIAGAIFGFSSVKLSFQTHKQIRDEVSAEANSHHAAVVADAQKYGNEEQIRRMVVRLANDPLGRAAAK